MPYDIQRSDEEIDEVLNAAAEATFSGSRWPGESYEEGVTNAIRWLLGIIDDSPMEG